jgi:hypothetical protein
VAHLARRYHAAIRDESTISAVVTLMRDCADREVCYSLTTILHAVVANAPPEMSLLRLRLRLLSLGAVDVLCEIGELVCKRLAPQHNWAQLVSQAAAKINNDNDADLTILRSIVNALAVILQKRTCLSAFCQLETNRIPALLAFVKCSDKKVCRQALKILGRLASVQAAKVRLLKEPENLPLLFALAQRSIGLSLSRTLVCPIVAMCVSVLC